MPLQLNCKIDVSSLRNVLHGLDAKIDAAIRPAAQAGAQVFYNEAVTRAPSKSGTLKSAIYQKFVPEESAEGVRATYKVSWRTGLGKGETGLPTAPHGALLEYGWIQRYAVYTGTDGQWYTAVRPEMRGKPAPKRTASQATKDAYYVLRKGGPVQWLPKSFIRSSYDAKYATALEAVKATLVAEISK
jgi:hypothetical protein